VVGPALPFGFIRFDRSVPIGAAELELER